MRNTNKKGFTIVELVIVVAVIAILAAVLIPTFSSIIRKANESKDNQLIKHLNTALAADVDGDKTIHAAVAAAAEFGFDLTKIDAKVEGNEILWDSVKNVFCYLNDGDIEYLDGSDKKEDDAKYWIIDDEISEVYSTYYYGGNNITSNTSTSICVVTNGEDLEINAPNADVYHYGVANNVNVVAVAPASYHVFAEVASLKVTKGHIVTEAGAKIQVLAVVDDQVTVTVSNNDVEILNVVIDSTNASTIAAAIKEAVKDVVDADAIKEVAADEVENAVSTMKTFADGNGTKDNPYIIMTAEQLKNIGNNYDKGYAYYKVADGVESIDCSSWPKNIKLNGSFDGNGVKLVNLSYALFHTVGYQNNNDTIVIKNVDVTMNTTDGTGFVRQIFNSGSTTFENVHIHGYIEGSYNMGSFYNYGTANYDGVGASYTVEFKNATSDATLICTTGNGIGGMIGHGFEGQGNTFTIIIDDASKYTGAMYTTNGSICDKLMYMCTNTGAFVLNDETVSGYDAAFNYASLKLASVMPEKDDNGEWTVATQNGVSYIVVSVGAQYTEYDKDGNKIPNGSGLTAIVGSYTIESPSGNIKVFDKFDSVELINEYIDGAMGYAVENGVLKIYVGPRNALEVNVTLRVTQYDATGNIIATGNPLVGGVKK